MKKTARKSAGKVKSTQPEKTVKRDGKAFAAMWLRPPATVKTVGRIGSGDPSDTRTITIVVCFQSTPNFRSWHSSEAFGLGLQCCVYHRLQQLGPNILRDKECVCRVCVAREFYAFYAFRALVKFVNYGAKRPIDSIARHSTK
jgi:hypothetical protein